MSLRPISPTYTNTNSKTWLAVRTVLLLLLLLAEILAFSIAYDLQPLQQNESYVLQVVGHGTSIFRVIAIAFMVLYAIGRRRIPALIHRWIELSSNNVWFWQMLAGHAVAASGFSLLSSNAFHDHGNFWPPWAVWLCLAAGGLALAFWLAAFAPSNFWIVVWRLKQPKILAISLLIGFVVDFAALVTSWLWYPLGDLTMVTSERLLNLVSRDVVYDRATRLLGTSVFQITIAPVCSGYEGIGLVTVRALIVPGIVSQELAFSNCLGSATGRYCSHLVL